jgi:hypothetical protein
MWLLILGAVCQVTGKPIRGSLGIAFELVWGLCFVWFLAAWLYAKQTGGQTLLDCGPHPSRKGFLLFAVISLVGGLTLVSGTTVLGITGPVLSGLSMGVFWLIMAGGRLQVRENGVWQYWGLLRWGKIESYHWADDCTLLVRVSSPISLWRRGALPVPPEYKDAFDQLLQKHLADRLPK